MGAMRTHLLASTTALVLLASPPLQVVDAKPVPLPKPQTEGGMPLMQALQARGSTRDFSPEKLPPQVLSTLLWAGFGVNRPDSGKRTAPSAMNWQEVDIYVVTAEGVSLYEAKAHALVPVLAGDLRALTGKQGYVKEAPLSLVYVADLARMGSASAEERALYSGADTAFIAQNVYLASASLGLGTVVRGSVDRDALGKALRLRPEQRVVLCQTVGYPKK